MAETTRRIGDTISFRGMGGAAGIQTGTVRRVVGWGAHVEYRVEIYRPGSGQHTTEVVLPEQIIEDVAAAKRDEAARATGDREAHAKHVFDLREQERRDGYFGGDPEGF